MFQQLRQGAFRSRRHDQRWRRVLERQGAALMEALAGGGERRVRLRTLTLIRWIAVVGQAFTILLVEVSLGIRLPVAPLVGAVLLSALISLALSLRSSPTTRVTERSAGVLLAYDSLQLGFLLALTGGLQNPFSVLLVVPVTISATILSLRTTLVLCALVIAVLTLLGLFPSELPWRAGGIDLPDLYILASWIALVLATMLVAAYAWRVADDARRMSDALAATHMALAREQQLSALGGLAAAAAHELGSPLATIAVTARELANGLSPDHPMAEEVAELVSQSQRCRDILRSLGQRPEDGEHARFTRVPLSHLVEELVRPYRVPEVDVVITIRRLAAPDQTEPAVAPAPELKHGLVNLIENALQFAEREVRLTVALREERIELWIEDDGPGFSDEVLERLGEPYLSSRQNDGGLGLGVFIAQTLLARTGAALQFGNFGRGACVIVTWDRGCLEQIVAEERHDGPRGASRV